MVDQVLIKHCFLVKWLYWLIKWAIPEINCRLNEENHGGFCFCFVFVLFSFFCFCFFCLFVCLLFLFFTYKMLTLEFCHKIIGNSVRCTTIHKFLSCIKCSQNFFFLGGGRDSNKIMHHFKLFYVFLTVVTKNVIYFVWKMWVQFWVVLTC